MVCTIKNTLFPKRGAIPPSNGFTVISLICNESKKNNSQCVTEDGGDLCGQEFVATGNFLPKTSGQQIEIVGVWGKDKNGRRNFTVTEPVKENIPVDRVGILAFLTSGLIKGIGPVTAGKIYQKFGSETIKILDADPSRLMEVDGVKEKSLEKIMTSYIENRGAKDIISKLAPLGVSTNKCVKIYDTFKQEAIRVINESPYTLCSVSGIGFAIADTIAKRNNIEIKVEDRIQAAGLEVLYQAENGGKLFQNGSGHLCISYSIFANKIQELLSYDGTQTPIKDIETAVTLMCKKKSILITRLDEKQEYVVYRSRTAKIEHNTARSIAELFLAESKSKDIDILDEIRKLELEKGFALAPEQSNAVVTGLSNNFTVITGGPGTGKTTIIDFIRTIYEKNNRGKNILLCAPTGRAARRMQESTGYDACTIHKAINIKSGEEVLPEDIEELPYDLIIMDEISMMDIYIANLMFAAIKRGCKVCLIGDVDQLPSVGPGAVLADIINCGAIPVAKLTKVYRQAGDSKIFTNSILMKNGNYQLDYDDNFKFIPASDYKTAAEKIEEIFMREKIAFGIDQTQILTPFRAGKTETSVESLNTTIQQLANPAGRNSKEIKIQNKVFRVGDKVMETTNSDFASNGDVGYIVEIEGTGTDAKIKIDYGDKRIVPYEGSEMESIYLAYANTVHKSQGSEYQVVIFNVMDGHWVMLQRNLIYTAITRAKTKVYIVGSKKALVKAITTGATEELKRTTLLKDRICKFIETKKSLVNNNAE